MHSQIFHKEVMASTFRDWSDLEFPNHRAKYLQTVAKSP